MSTSPFIEGTSIQYAWDSTSLGLLKECPRKYQLTMIDGWRRKGSDLSVHLRFGLLFHSGLELYDKIQASHGLSHDDAVDYVLQFLLEQTWDRSEVCPEGAPWTPDHNAKTRPNLIRSVFWYLEEYANDGAKTIILENGKPAVELSFRFETDFSGPDGRPFLLSGHLDRLVTFGDDTFVMDRKTTGTTLSSYYFKQYSPDNQMSLYTLAGKILYKVPVSGVIIDAAQIAVGFTAFSRGITMRSANQLEEWLESTYHWFNTAIELADRGYYPMNEKSCNNYGGCTFRDICSIDPVVRRQFLETSFEISHWNPLEER